VFGGHIVTCESGDCGKQEDEPDSLELSVHGVKCFDAFG